nr:PriCT-2 domain-containing protein [Gammaproteobacteria bacterium]
MNSQTNRTIARQDVAELLERIPSEDTNTCLKVGSALKNEFGDQGFNLFLCFCSKADNFEPNWVKATWRSVKANRATVGLIVYLASKSSNPSCNSQARVKKASVASKVLDIDDARRMRFARKIWSSCKTDDQYVAGHPYAIAKEITWAAGAARGLVSGSRVG